jgi:hypothetical protein
MQVFLGGYAVDQPHEIRLPLVPQRRKDQVVWTGDSLFLKRKFIPSGGRILPGPSRDRMEITLSQEPNGDLRYKLLHRATAQGRVVNQIECVWSRVRTK